MKKTLFLFGLVGLLLFSCSEDETTKVNTTCGATAEIIDESSFYAINTTNYTITNVTRNANCLEITISSSGCNPELWEMNLYSTTIFCGTPPIVRPARLKLTNNQLCAAVFQKTISFDLTPFRITGMNQLPIVLEGWNQQILYQY